MARRKTRLQQKERKEGKRTFSKKAIISSCLMFLAQCQGLSPALLLALTFAPRLSSSSAPSTQPMYAQLWSGVFPAASTSFTFAPSSIAFLMAAHERPDGEIRRNRQEEKKRSKRPGARVSFSRRRERRKFLESHQLFPSTHPQRSCC